MLVLYNPCSWEHLYVKVGTIIYISYIYIAWIFISYYINQVHMLQIFTDEQMFPASQLPRLQEIFPSLLPTQLVNQQ